MQQSNVTLCHVYDVSRFFRHLSDSLTVTVLGLCGSWGWGSSFTSIHDRRPTTTTWRRLFFRVQSLFGGYLAHTHTVTQKQHATLTHSHVLPFERLPSDPVRWCRWSSSPSVVRAVMPCAYYAGGWWWPIQARLWENFHWFSILKRFCLTLRLLRLTMLTSAFSRTAAPPLNTSFQF